MTVRLIILVFGYSIAAVGFLSQPPLSWFCFVVAFPLVPHPFVYDWLYLRRIRRKFESLTPSPPTSEQSASSAARIANRPPLVGLALAGGGAKGAYQIGVLEALSKQNVRFDAIAGTSIGAFNAALVSSVGLERARNTWRRLTTTALLGGRCNCIRTLLCLPLLLPLNLLHLWSSIQYRPLAGVIRVENFVGALATAILLWLLRSQQSPAGLFLFLSFIIVSASAYPFWKALNASLFDGRLLRQLVNTHVDVEALRLQETAIWVTIASLEPTLNPADAIRAVQYRQIGVSESKLRPLLNELSTQPQLVAHYRHLNRRLSEDVMAYLAASMALPVGIFPAVVFDGLVCVDGGRADNIPILPLIRQGCRRIYVIHLTPVVENRLAHDLERILRSRALAGYDAPRADSSPSVSVELVHVAPAHRLGVRWLDTIWFSPRRAAKLYELGFRDGMAACRADVVAIRVPAWLAGERNPS